LNKFHLVSSQTKLYDEIYKLLFEHKVQGSVNTSAVYLYNVHVILISNQWSASPKRSIHVATFSSCKTTKDYIMRIYIMYSKIYELKQKNSIRVLILIRFIVYCRHCW